MALSPLAKGALVLLALSGTSVAVYGVGKGYDGSIERVPDVPAEIKKIKDNSDYKDVFPSYICSVEFNSDVLEHKSFQTLTSDLTINLGADDFLSDIENTKRGCFNMKTNTSRDEKSIVGFVEFSAITEKYGIAMQTEFNLGKESNSFDGAYFLNKLSLLKKENDSWKLDKAFAWKEDEKIKGKQYYEIIASPKQVFQMWVKKDGGDDSLFKNLAFQIPTTFGKGDENSNFVFSDVIFSYSSGSGYGNNGDKKINIKDEGKGYENMPKGIGNMTKELENLIRRSLLIK